MRTGFIGSIVVGIAALAVTPGLLAQSAPRSGTAKADLSGIWNRRAVSDRFGTLADDPGGVPFLGFGKGVPPLRSEGMDKYKANRQGIAEARAKGRDDLDPLSSCFPPGPARIFTLPRPFEIRQTPDTVYILSEFDHVVRRIYVDGRVTPDGYPSVWMGYSIGKYEGDTLLVDTTAISDQTWIDSLGTPHSEDLHLTERFRRVNQNTLEIEFTFDDPKTFTKPWTGKKVFQLQPPGFEMKEHVICEEYRKLGLRKDGYEFIINKQ